MRRDPLKPLIPLDDLKKVVAGLVRVPKDATTRPKPEAPPSASVPKPKS